MKWVSMDTAGRRRIFIIVPVQCRQGCTLKKKTELVCKYSLCSSAAAKIVEVLLWDTFKLVECWLVLFTLCYELLLQQWRWVWQFIFDLANSRGKIHLAWGSLANFFWTSGPDHMVISTIYLWQIWRFSRQLQFSMLAKAAWYVKGNWFILSS